MYTINIFKYESRLYNILCCFMRYLCDRDLRQEEIKIKTDDGQVHNPTRTAMT